MSMPAHTNTTESVKSTIRSIEDNNHNKATTSPIKGGKAGSDKPKKS